MCNTRTGDAKTTHAVVQVKIRIHHTGTNNQIPPNNHQNNSRNLSSKPDKIKYRQTSSNTTMRFNKFCTQCRINTKARQNKIAEARKSHSGLNNLKARHRQVRTKLEKPNKKTQILETLLFARKCLIKPGRMDIAQYITHFKGVLGWGQEWVILRGKRPGLCCRVCGTLLRGVGGGPLGYPETIGTKTTSAPNAPAGKIPAGREKRPAKDQQRWQALGRWPASMSSLLATGELLERWSQVIYLWWSTSDPSILDPSTCWTCLT